MLNITRLHAKGFESLVIGKDPSCGFHGIIAVHSTRLGPSLGGIRMWPYADEREALHDVERLASAMTKKAALSGLPMGGGKAVIIGNPEKDKDRALLHAMGQLIESLEGTYIAAKDSGILAEDLDVISEVTRHVSGTTSHKGGSGDPSLSTAQGVLAGMQAACQAVFGTPSLDGRTVAIQGVGHVGWHLGDLLHRQGAKLFVADLQASRVQRAQHDWHAVPVSLDEIHQTPADIFAPCALGGVLNVKTIPQLQVKIVAGGANNQCLDEDKDPVRLMERNIVHVPDYILNAGGLIQLVVKEILLQQQVEPWIANIGKTVQQVLSLSSKEQLPPLVMANRLALQKLNI